MKNLHIRWFINRDLPFVLEIDKKVFTKPWTEQEFIDYRRNRHNIGMVAEIEDNIVGYFLYCLKPRVIRIDNIAVQKQLHRQGIGKQMVDRLKSKLDVNKRSKLDVYVSEDNLDAQLFFKQQGFIAIEVVRGFLPSGRDAYLMRYDLRRENDSDIERKNSVGN